MDWQTRPVWQSACWVIKRPLLCLILFIHKPFHIGHTLFLTMADLLPRTLFGDAVGEAYFLGEHDTHLNPYESTHPLFISWYLKFLDAQVLLGLVGEKPKPKPATPAYPKS